MFMQLSTAIIPFIFTTNFSTDDCCTHDGLDDTDNETASQLVHQ